jgi:phosphoglycolate phosphatase-like HAD superfamily hydrolase
MDGVLVDSTGSVEMHWSQWAARRRLDREQVLGFAHGSPSREVVARFVAAEDVAEDVAEEAAWVEGLALDGPPERALPGALEALTQRHLPVAVVTSATRHVARVRLQRAGLPVPAVLVGADDVASGQARSGALSAGRRPARRRGRRVRRGGGQSCRAHRASRRGCLSAGGENDAPAERAGQFVGRAA